MKHHSWQGSEYVRVSDVMDRLLTVLDRNLDGEIDDAGTFYEICDVVDDLEGIEKESNES